MVPVHTGTLPINQLLYHIYIIFYISMCSLVPSRVAHLPFYLSLSTLIYMDERDKQLLGNSKHGQRISTCHTCTGTYCISITRF